MSWALGLGQLTHDANLDVQSGRTSNSQAGGEISGYISANGVVLWLCGILVAINIAMILMYPMIAPFTFFISLLAPLIIGWIINMAMSYPMWGGGIPGGENGIIPWALGFYQGPEYQFLLTAQYFMMIALKGTVSFAGLLGNFGPVGLVFTIVGLLLKLAFDGTTGDMLAAGLAVSGIFIILGCVLTSAKLIAHPTEDFYKISWCMSAISMQYYLFEVIL